MPGGDGTGPDGKGAKTGRKLGRCSGYPDPGYTKGSRRRVYRRSGTGRGPGRRNQQ